MAGISLNDDALLRYSRHILLPQIGIEGQEKLGHSHVLVVGAGGLGSPAAIYLASSGVGHITLCDDDAVDLTNLQRQIIHETASVGMPKALSAKKTLERINPLVEVSAIEERIKGKRLGNLVQNADLVIDACDNFPTRIEINQACVKFRKPLVSGAAIGFHGQVTTFDLRKNSSPCYQCLFPQDAFDEEMRCAVMGVFSPLVGIIGATQAAEGLKTLMGIGENLSGRLLLLDGLSMKWREISLMKDESCPVCATHEISL